MTGAHEVEHDFFAIDIAFEAGRIVRQHLGELLRSHLGKDEVRHFARVHDAFLRIVGDPVADLRTAQAQSVGDRLIRQRDAVGGFGGLLDEEPEADLP